MHFIITFVHWRQAMKGAFPHLYGGIFLKVEGTFFRSYFLRVAVIFSPYVENFLGLSIVLLILEYSS